MNQIIKLLIFSVVFFSCSAQDSFNKTNQFRYQGVENDPTIDPDFAKGSDKIKASIQENLNHLNLYEFAHALPELYELIDQGEVKIEDWKAYIDSLENNVREYMSDTIQAYWAVDHLGLIPLQVDFLLASINKSEKLKNQYPKVFEKLINNTSQMKGLGYVNNHYDSLIKVSDTKGESTLWYFLQLEDCTLMNLISNLSNDQLIFLASHNSMAATFKVPFYLQKRKWYSLKRRFDQSDSPDCQKFGKQMEKVIISINDNDRDYFKNSLKNGIDPDKIKEF